MQNPHTQAVKHHAGHAIWLIKALCYTVLVFSIFVLFAAIYLFVEVGKHEDGSVKVFGNLSASITMFFSLFVIGLTSYTIGHIDNSSPFVKAFLSQLLSHKSDHEIAQHVNVAGQVSQSPQIAHNIHRTASNVHAQQVTQNTHQNNYNVNTSRNPAGHQGNEDPFM